MTIIYISINWIPDQFTGVYTLPTPTSHHVRRATLSDKPNISIPHFPKNIFQTWVKLSDPQNITNTLYICFKWILNVIRWKAQNTTMTEHPIKSFVETEEN